MAAALIASATREQSLCARLGARHSARIDSLQPQDKFTRKGCCLPTAEEKAESRGSRPCREEMWGLRFESGLGASSWTQPRPNKHHRTRQSPEVRPCLGPAAAAGSRGPLPTPAGPRPWLPPSGHRTSSAEGRNVAVRCGGCCWGGWGGRWDDGWFPRRRPLWPDHTDRTHIHPPGS